MRLKFGVLEGSRLFPYDRVSYNTYVTVQKTPCISDVRGFTTVSDLALSSNILGNPPSAVLQKGS